MVLILALEADLCEALLTLDKRHVEILRPQSEFALFVRADPHQRIFLPACVGVKYLRQYRGSVVEENVQLVLTDFLSASNEETFCLVACVCCNILLKDFFGTVYTERMAAVESER